MTFTRRSLILSGAGGAFSKIGHAFDNCPASPRCEAIRSYACHEFPDSKGVRHAIYVRGKGPPVLVLHELPGLTSQDIRLADKLVSDGYTALVPLLFGEPCDNRPDHFLTTVCGKDQFDCGASGTTPPEVNWVREFAATVRQTWKDGLGMGVIGMCLTGEFPLTLLSVPEMKAAVMCQPTDPFNLLTLLHLGPGSKLSVSDNDIKNAQKSGVPILGIRYASDFRCPEARFRTLAARFPKQFYWLELEGSSHSSLGEEFCEAAFEEVRLYLGQQLKRASPIPGKAFPNLAQLTATAPGKRVCCPQHSKDCK